MCLLWSMVFLKIRSMPVRHTPETRQTRLALPSISNGANIVRADSSPVSLRRMVRFWALPLFHEHRLDPQFSKHTTLYILQFTAASSDCVSPDRCFFFLALEDSPQSTFNFPLLVPKIKGSAPSTVRTNGYWPKLGWAYPVCILFYVFSCYLHIPNVLEPVVTSFVLNRTGVPSPHSS